MKTTKLKLQFVELIPRQLEDSTLYISISYDTAVHKCACGCGKEVVTPLSKNGWSFTYNGEDVSLDPSIGNFKFDCKSHYWIRNSQIEWEPLWRKHSLDEVVVNKSWWSRILASIFG